MGERGRKGGREIGKEGRGKLRHGFLGDGRPQHSETKCEGVDRVHCGAMYLFIYFSLFACLLFSTANDERRF